MPILFLISLAVFLKKKVLSYFILNPIVVVANYWKECQRRKSQLNELMLNFFLEATHNPIKSLIRVI